MANATLVKEIGTDFGPNRVIADTALKILSRRAKFLYPTEFDGASAHFGSNSDQIVIHLTGSPSLTDADQALADIEKPTCTFSLLDITVNVGALVVNDVTSIDDDPLDEKFIKVVVVIDDVSGAIQIYVLEKTTEQYPSLPAGKTFCANLKEYSLAAAGTTLVEINDFIDQGN